MDRTKDYRPWFAVTFGVLAAASAMRFWLNFRTPYPPATDAGYYPMQTVFRLVHGRLMYDDLPILFWLNAALTKVLMGAGIPLHEAALLASRVLDCVLQPWTAVAVMVAGYCWSGGRRRAIPGCAAAAVMVVMSPMIFRMLSNFEKNSLGLVWMAASLWACRCVMANPTIWRWALLTLFLILGALTHLGAFGMTAGTLAVAVASWYWRTRVESRQRGLSVILVFGGLAAAVAALMYYAEPQRAVTLLRGPLRMFAGPMMTPSLVDCLLTLAVVGFAAHRLWRDHRELPSADVAMVIGLIAAMAFMLVPKELDHFERLFMMTAVPGAFLIAFVLSRRSVEGASEMPALLLLAITLIMTAFSPRVVQGPYINEDVASELRHFRLQVPDPLSTLVVAPHGLDWWTGYFLGTPVRMRLPNTPFSRYRRVLLIRNTNAFRPPDRVGASNPTPITVATPIHMGRYIEAYEFPGPPPR